MNESELLKMMKEEDEKFDKRFSSISETDRDEIKGNAKIKHLENFDAEKSSEIYFYNDCLRKAQSNWYNKTTIAQKDEDGNSIQNERGKEIRETKIPTVRISENIDNDTDENEELNLNEDIKTEAGDINKRESDDTIEIEEPKEGHTFLDYLKEKFSWYHEYLDDSKKADDSVESKWNGKVLKVGKIKSLPDAIFEIRNYLLLSGRIKKLGRNEPMRRTYKPTKDSIPYPDVPKFYNLSDVSKETLRRLQYLKNSESRKWMEMTISEMRRSKEKMEEYISNWNVEKQKKFREKTPILSSVILDKDGKFVASCFKGKMDRTHPDKKEKDVTFDNHCEFSLFTDIIKEENLHLVKDGILYVTLEPCNKRGFWLDGDKATPKIPCAVRCLEAGVKKVFIGSIDDNNQVKNKGKEILESGKYAFKMKDGKLCGTETEIKEEGLLEEYFKVKNYQSENFKNKRVYTIGTPVEVHDFEPDLIEEVRQLNSEFLQRHSPDKFRL